MSVTLVTIESRVNPPALGVVFVSKGHADLGNLCCHLELSRPGLLPRTMSGSLVLPQPVSVLMSVACVVTRFTVDT